MILTALALAAALAGQASARTVFRVEHKVILVVADTATWEDYTGPAAPFIRRWLPECAVGLMNGRTAGLATPPAAYLTLGASSRISAELDPDLAELALNYNESYEGSDAPAVFRARTGGVLPPGALGYIALPHVQRENAEATYPLRLGLIGESLRRAGLKTAAIGNADLPYQYRRHIATIVMDESGVVPVGDIGRSMHLPDPGLEPPLMTDYAAVTDELHRALKQAAVIAVETGDLSRINARSQVMTPQRVDEERLAAVARMDTFLAHIVGLMRGRPWRLYLVTPSAAYDPRERSDLLLPIIAWGDGISSGLLSSPSTRRAGVVANVDLAPDVLQFLSVAIPSEAIGRPMYVRPAPGGDALGYVTRQHQDQARVEANRPYVLKRISGIVVAVFTVIAALLILGGPMPRGVMVGLREAALFVMAFPLGALVFPGRVALTPLIALLCVIAVTTVVYAGARSLRRWAPPYAWVAGVFAAVLCADLVLRQNLVQDSLLSYSVTVGARYYGLGNELGGVLLAAVPLALGGWLGARQPGRAVRLASALLLACVIIAIGHPAMGANFGIAVPAALGFGLMALGLYSPQLKARHLLIAVVVALAAGVLVGGANWLIAPEGRSHIGRAFEAARHGGLTQMIAIFSRKVAFNWLLARHTIATWVLVSALAVIAGSAMGRSRAVSEEAQAGSPLGLGLICAAVASGVSFFLNDSGVLSAAWGLLLVAAALTYIALDWRLRQGVATVG
ncbi:MAG: hypothetical protein JSV65_14520 [Armatimonadota bacterium]|nr:MAG: hypothetical protein JSV65_14520 [Armatimonadota bacterium]